MSKVKSEPGPFRVEQLQDGDRYELYDGHPLFCAPSGGRHAKSSLRGGLLLSSDPDVAEAGFDAGYAVSAQDLRAPDIAVGNVPDESGWLSGAPRLAVEFAGVGQDEEALQQKITDLLGRGTEYVWVVRLEGPRRVEVYEPGVAMMVRGEDEVLEAQGTLRNPVPVRSLFDEGLAIEATLRNLLQREGYESLDEVREEGRKDGIEQGRKDGIEQGRKDGIEQGRKDGIEQGRKDGQRTQLQKTLMRQLERRFGSLDEAHRAQIAAASYATLEAWADEVIDAENIERVFSAKGTDPSPQ